MKRKLQRWAGIGSRRRFLRWLGGIAAGSLVLSWLPRKGAAADRSLREAMFYRPSERKKQRVR